MRKKIMHYCGEEINPDIISKINSIALTRFTDDIYRMSFEFVNDLESLCLCHFTKAQEEELILGEDWYIIYAEREYSVEILEWYAMENAKDKFSQAMEMYTALKKILLLSKDKRVCATMRHDTSYKIYHSLLIRGYVEEFNDTLTLEKDNRPIILNRIIDKLKEKYRSLEEYLNHDKRDRFPEYEKYIYHYIAFELTDKFIKKYTRAKS